MAVIDTELTRILGQVGEELAEEYCLEFSRIFESVDLGFSREGLPLQAIEGIAQAFADTTGYHVELHADVLVPIDGGPDIFRTIGKCRVSLAEPSVFSVG